MSVKDRIVQKRKEMGLNQTELAKRAGLKPPAISQYESGVRNPSYEAIVKLSNALNVKVDYLVSGTIDNDEQISLDPQTQVLSKIMQHLSQNHKEKLIDYAFNLSGQNKILDIWSTDPKQYAKYIFDIYFEKQLPLDISRLVEITGIEVIKGDLEGKAEAKLLKKNRTIIIDQKINHQARIKFILATLIGHAVLPWHINEVYYCRKAGKSTLETENTEEMEATALAVDLITPPDELAKDLAKFKTIDANLLELRELAERKYEVSLTALCNRLVEQYESRFAVVTGSSDCKITKTFSSNISLIDKGSNLDSRSIAFGLLSDSSIQEEEFRSGKVPATAWIVDASEDEFVYESSVFNPKYKSVLTLITK